MVFLPNRETFGIPLRIFKLTEYRAVIVRMPASRDCTLHLVCSRPVTSPARPPAINAISVPINGCPFIANTADTAHPVVKLPSIVRSGIFKTRKEINTPSDMMENIMPRITASCMVDNAITFILSSSILYLVSSASYM